MRTLREAPHGRPALQGWGLLTCFAFGLGHSALADTDHYARCAACHLADGTGVPGMFPPLAGNAHRFFASPEGRSYLASLVVGGANGAIEIQGVSYAGVMPAVVRGSVGRRSGQASQRIGVPLRFARLVRCSVVRAGGCCRRARSGTAEPRGTGGAARTCACGCCAGASCPFGLAVALFWVPRCRGNAVDAGHGRFARPGRAARRDADRQGPAGPGTGRGERDAVRRAPSRHAQLDARDLRSRAPA